MATDVNQQLLGERRRSIESGTMTRQTGGRWVGYDKAEVLGKDGLDETTGQAALYTTTPAWHGLGSVIPGGTTDIDKVLELGRLDWEVEKRPVLYATANHGQRYIDGSFATVRTDTSDPLGIVGSRYEIIQNRQGFEFLEDLTGEFGLSWESAGALRGGRKVFVTVKVPEHIVVDRGGLDDEVALFLAFINSHDGSSKSETVVTPWRIVCANTERFALRDAASRWGIRHTSGALERLEEARRTLKLTRAYEAQFVAEETALARTDLEIDAFHKLIDGLWKVDEEATERTKQIADKRHDEMDAMFRSEAMRAGRTAYAAERVVTDYLDHRTRVVPGSLTADLARAQRALVGTQDELKDKAHRRLLLVR